MKTKLLCAKTAMFALACFSSIGVWGQIKITDENGLKAIAENLNGDYVLENNITLSKEWEPIGTNDSPFTGTIDGKGFTIYGLKINRPEQNSVGFIGTAKIEDVSSTKVTVKNLRLVGVEIFGHQDVGAVIGNSYGAKVSECYTSGLVYGWDHTGGIIGGTKKVDDDDNIMTQVSNCYSNAAVVSSSYQAGGIIGASINSVVDRCYFSGVAVCPEGRSGGIVALNDGNSLTITNCVTLSSYIKAGSGDAGGANAILGADNPAEDSNAVSTISNSYSWSGLKLYENNVEIARSNNANDSYDGGYLDLDELKTAQFWLGDVNFDAGIWTMVENTYPSLSNVQVPLENYIYIPSFPERCLPGKTFNAEAIPASGRTITYTSSNPEIATIDSKGKISFLKDGKTTLTFVDQGDNYVKGCTKTYELEVKGVAYTIMDEEDLRCVKYDLAGDFKLGADIYLTKDWELMDVFTGTLDGQGYTIHNLRYINEEQGRVGLFGEATGATIKRVGIAGAYLNGNEDVGAIVGYANGCNISECFVDQASYIAGRDHIGSIVGKVEKMEVEEEGSAEKVITGTTVSDCYSMAKVYSREYQAGGVVGVVNYGTVERCYFSGNIRATKGRAGGIFSLVDADGKVFVENNVCLASGIYCSEATYCIGENGRTSTATLTNNYVDHYASYKGTDLSSSAPSDVYDNASNNGEKLESDEVLSSEWYKETLGWDFDNIWTFIEGGEGNMYPILKCQQSKVLTPVIYGIPEPAFLIQLADGSSSESLNLERIKSTCGQKLIFKITKGEEYIYIDGTIVDFSGAKEVDGETVATISIAPEVEITGLKPFETTAFDINMVGQSHVFPINNVADLLDVNNKLFASFCLMNDIDMTGVEFEGFGSLESPFTGSFDGNGHTIKNPVVITNDDNTKGFFNATKGAKIKNLGISNFSFSGSQANGNKSTDLGGFAGSAKETTFDQCYLTGKVVGRDHVGGFVGGNCSNVTITNSFVNAEVFAYSQAGGFFGVAAGNVTMKNCYFAGSVKLNPSHSYGWVGGFVGLVDADCTVTIEDCVSIGNLQGSVASGSFIGANGGDQKNTPRGIINFTGNVFNFDAERFLMDGKISENDWESQGYVTKEGGVVESPIEHYATPVEDNEFLTQIPYNDAKFDFENIWTIDEEVSYPTLKNVAYIPAPPVGIEQVVDQNENTYIVYTSDNAIFVSGMKNTAKIALYNINGQLVSNVITSGENIELPIMGKGFYIVRIVEDEMTTTVKVVVK